MNILAIVQEFCRRTGLTVPNIVMSSQDEQLLQIVGLMNEGLSDLTTNIHWQDLTTEATFVTVATASQGALTTIADAGFQWIINDTMYNRTSNTVILGPLNEREWQERQAYTSAGPYNQYRINGGLLKFDPMPTAGETVAFEYLTKYAVQDATNLVTPNKRWFVKDDDIFRLDEELIIAYARWAWKKEKGFAYFEDFQTYERLKKSMSNHDKTAKTLHLDNEKRSSIGIIVPDHNIPVT